MSDRAGSGPVERLRAEIDAVDARLLELLNRRAELVLEVQRAKARAGLARLDRTRMERIIERLVSINAGPLSAGEIREIYGELLNFFAHHLRPR